MKPLSHEEVVELYVETFGEEPEITGSSFFDGPGITEKLIQAITNGEPFKDIPVPDGALV